MYKDENISQPSGVQHKNSRPIQHTKTTNIIQHINTLNEKYDYIN